MKPEAVPTKPGDPCWTRASVEKNLSPTAQLSSARKDWFLATHSPIQCKSTTGETRTDSALFDRFFRSAAHEQLVVIKGPPGAGKSQLINWLRLRFEDALLHGEQRPSNSTTLRTVLIRRRSGSLKDALEQLVDQLPEYKRFLVNVQDAITQISDDQARRKLSFAIALALGEQKEKGILDNDLQNLREVFQDVRLIETMCREGGTIDKNIQRLISESDVQARERLPAFSPEDFDFRGKRRGQVDTLMLDLLEEEETLRAKAAEAVNAVLRSALASVTGIKGQTLHEVFRGIRRAMKAASEDLALFVEDVSTMSILDEELVNALEPQGDTDLCRMLSVLGMTLPAYNRLQENKKDRITEAWEVQGDLGESGALLNTEDTDRFVARYLNALRAGDTQTSALVQGRRTEGDVALSACEGCDQREECFRRFSSVPIGDTRIGLFPLTAGAASRLLEGLDRPDGGRNPRVLLRHVLLPLLENFALQGRQRLGSFGINVKPAVPSDSTSASATILGGWSAADKGRLNYLTWYWAGQQSISSSRELLEPVLHWFGMPAFGGSLPSQTSTTPPAPRGRLKVTTTESTAPQWESREVPRPLQDARDRLTGWMHQQKKLTRDADFRELLLAVVKSSIDEENTRSPSSEVRAVATGRTPLKTSNIVIQDMESRPSVYSKARFIFNRDQSTFDLLNALLDFKYLGRESWDFEGGVTQQRVFAQWLRRERKRLLDSFDTTEVRPEVAQRVAAAFLVIAYRFSKRTALPSDTADAVEALCSFEPNEPEAVTDAAARLASDASTRVENVRGFLLRHLSVPQGSATSINYIDSRVLQEAVTEYRRSVQLPEVESQTLSTFPEIFSLLKSDWSRILASLQDEQAELNKRLGHLSSIMERWAIEAVDLKEGEDTLTARTRIFLESVRKVEKSCADAGHVLGNSELQNKIKDLAPAKVQALIAILRTAAEAVEGSPEGVLSLDVAPLLKLYTFIDAVHQAMLNLERSLTLNKGQVITEADVEVAKDEAEMAVQKLESCLNEVDPPVEG